MYGEKNRKLERSTYEVELLSGALLKFSNQENSKST